MSKHPLAGSEREPLPRARAVGKADPAERLEVTVLVRCRDADRLTEHVAKLAAGDQDVNYLSREEFAAQHGADPAAVAAVRAFADAHGLATVQVHPGRRAVVLSGTVAQFDAAFGVDLQRFDYDGGSYRGRTGEVQIPDELKDVVVAVLGLDDRPVAQPHFRPGPPSRQGGVGVVNPDATASASFTPTQLAKLYGFPPGDGKGQCIAIIELGGGFRRGDIGAYFSHLGLAVPKVTAVSVDHGKNNPGTPSGPDGEVMLDIEVAGAVAPGAHIAVYFAPNTDAGFLDAITTAAHDAVNKPSVISISWGGPESSWTPQSLAAYDSAFQAAAAMGITVLAASGDNGSGDGAGDGKDHVDFPASSPHVTGCGGTRVQASGSKITDETVWNENAQSGASGGGVSAFFDLPPWQAGLQVTRTQGGAGPLTKRGVPDVAGDADPQTGYAVRVDGQDMVIGGTSAVAPLWAGLIALINAGQGGPVGFINPALYRGATALRDITQGNNGSFAAGLGWDACTGLGSPDGAKVAEILRPAAPVA